MITQKYPTDFSLFVFFFFSKLIHGKSKFHNFQRRKTTPKKKKIQVTHCLIKIVNYNIRLPNTTYF